jgi:hypothetical protein
MSVRDLETAVRQLSQTELMQFANWFDEYRAAQWDEEILRDQQTGRPGVLIQQAQNELAARRCRQL